MEHKFPTERQIEMLARELVKAWWLGRFAGLNINTSGAVPIVMIEAAADASWRIEAESARKILNDGLNL